jgi:hypothetical protein
MRLLQNLCRSIHLELKLSEIALTCNKRAPYLLLENFGNSRGEEGAINESA